jgi:hypothetical protein
MGTYSITPTVAQGMLNATGYAEALGASPVLKIYSGAVPANAAATNAGTLLATLACAATPISGYTDTGTAGRATFGAITSATAVATGTASFWRRQTAGGVVIDQGSCGTAGADLNLNTTAITSGSTVSVTSATTDLPYGP